MIQLGLASLAGNFSVAFCRDDFEHERVPRFFIEHRRCIRA
jgi:hypothetical protein